MPALTSDPKESWSRLQISWLHQLPSSMHRPYPYPTLTKSSPLVMVQATHRVPKHCGWFAVRLLLGYKTNGDSIGFWLGA